MKLKNINWSKALLNLTVYALTIALMLYILQLVALPLISWVAE